MTELSVPHLGSGKILIVEDDVDLAETYSDLLESQGHSTLSASGVVEAIEVSVRAEPSIIVLDLSLSDGRGFRVLDFVRGYQPLKTTKVIVVTGHTEMTNHTELLDHADMVLSKPISNDQLLTMIERLIYQTAH